MEEKLRQLKVILNEALDLDHVVNLLEWDAETYMPPGSAEDRGYLRATVESLMHRKYASEEVGRLLEELKPWAEQLDPDSDDARLVRITEREYLHKVKVPPEMVAEMAQLRTMATQVWQEARQANDFVRFRPYLEKIVDWRRRYADLFAPYEHIYDPLLAEFEPGMKTAEVQAIFNALRPQQVALVQAIASRPQVEADFLYQPYDEQKQWDFGAEVITRFGYDWNHGRQDRAPHPFTTHFGIGDVRITTRFMPDYFSSAFFSTTHECGHALYEMGIDRTLARTTLARGTTMAMHESQSRLWENLVGRSRPFWEGAYPRLQAYFPMQLGALPLEKFYKGINKVEPSLIRVEADEATYNLHIMLRLELEIALVEGSLEVKDLPEAWNARMQDYLGLTPPNDALGVMQDIHWSSGYFGYFSTYALGNLIASQLWERIVADIPDLTDQIRRGEFAALLGWLREKVHRHGRKFEAQEMVQRITGSKIDPAPYLRYLQTKYGDIYGF
jgi:carboxypeptidase Taq